MTYWAAQVRGGTSWHAWSVRPDLWGPGCMVGINWTHTQLAVLTLQPNTKPWPTEAAMGSPGAAEALLAAGHLWTSKALALVSLDWEPYTPP